jgi:hypothetical protein
MPVPGSLLSGSFFVCLVYFVVRPAVPGVEQALSGSSGIVVGTVRYGKQVIVCASSSPGVCSRHENHPCYL